MAAEGDRNYRKKTRGEKREITSFASNLLCDKSCRGEFDYKLGSFQGHDAVLHGFLLGFPLWLWISRGR